MHYGLSKHLPERLQLVFSSAFEELWSPVYSTYSKKEKSVQLIFKTTGLEGNKINWFPEGPESDL